MKIFCPLPFTEIFVAGNRAKPCCAFDGGVEYSKYFTSDQIRSVKEKFLNGQFPTNCKSCEVNEQTTGYSFRKMALQFQSEETALTENYTPEYFNIKRLLISTGNICNLKCLPCGGQSSFIRGQELYSLGLSKNIPIVQINKNLSAFLDAEFDEITITGGEPFEDKTITEFLENLVKAGKSTNIRLDLNTNLTLITEQKMEFLSKNFKKVYIKGSIDGIGIVNDYLRYPSKWNTISSAIKLIQSFKEVDLCVTTALSNLALLRYYEVFEWAEENNILDRFLSIVSDPLELHPSIIPIELKELLHKKYTSLKQQCKTMSDRTSETVDTCIRLCENQDDSPAEFCTSLDWIKKHDKLRNTNITDVFPELTKYLI